ncbi:MAG: nucleoside triphosphate pyrophosphohydrolase [Ruminococcaceae bacterium]|nr:nucleoside triphosphate pyrophosphohydrolase [Oscillospiraceae bacterium]
MIQNFDFKTKYSVEDLVEIIRLLRTPEGCPWDREQSHESIKKNFIEETYEVIEAINKDNPAMLREELGDVLMQVLLHAQMEQEKGNFDFHDIVNELAQKLVIRHPHVFGNEHCENAEEVLVTWDRVKTETKNQTTITEAMEAIPKELPALMRAQKIQKKAAKVGFDWDDVSGALEKVHSECAELEQAIQSGNRSDCFEELGDLLFSCVNVSRFLHCDSEESLTAASDKFMARFAIVEKLATQRGIAMKDASLECLDALWDEAKEMCK